MNNTKILDQLYRSEIDYRIDTHWDAGITARLGNGYGGEYIEQATFEHIQQALLWLKDRAVHHFPDSTFAQKATAEQALGIEKGACDCPFPQTLEQASHMGLMDAAVTCPHKGEE